MDTRITLVIGSVGPVYDRGLAALLDEDDDLEVVASGLGLAELEAAVVEHSPRVAVLGQRQLGEPRVLRRLAEICPGIGLVVLTSTEIPDALRIQLIALGANACLPEHTSRVDLVTAVRYAAEGKGMWATTSGSAEPMLAAMLLTARESQVFELAQYRGLTNCEIARELRISPSTVETHIKRIRRKLGIIKHRRALRAQTSSRGFSM